MQEFFIKDYTNEYQNKVRSLADDTLGKDYVTSEELALLNKDSNSKAFVLVNANDDLVGFCFYDIADYLKAQEISKNNFATSLKGEVFGYVRTIAVSKDYQGQRLGNYILDSCIKKLNERGITKFFTSIWDKPLNRSNVKMVEHSGFKKVAVLPDYWYEESIKENYDCPICGNPCHCNCIIMANF